LCSINNLSSRTVFLTLAAATSNDHNNNNNNYIKTKVIPVVIGATGTISKLFRKYVSKILGKHKIEELQKSAVFDTDGMNQNKVGIWGTAHSLESRNVQY